MKCPRCGTTVPDNSDICPKCGVRFIKRVRVVSRTLTPPQKANTLANSSPQEADRPAMELMIRQARNSMIVLVLVGLVPIAITFFYIAIPELEFRDPALVYSALGAMIGICFGGALLLMRRKKRLENGLAKKKVYVIDRQRISKRKIVRPKTPK